MINIDHPTSSASTAPPAMVRPSRRSATLRPGGNFVPNASTASTGINVYATQSRVVNDQSSIDFSDSYGDSASFTYVQVIGGAAETTQPHSDWEQRRQYFEEKHRRTFVTSQYVVSTPALAVPLDAKPQVSRIFSTARTSTFELGMVSQFSGDLESEIRSGGIPVVVAIAELIFDPRTSADVAGEALRSLAHSQDESSYESRRRVIESGLSHVHVEIRDAALMAISVLGDPRSCPAVEAAARREQVEWLQSDMRKVVAELRG